MTGQPASRRFFYGWVIVAAIFLVAAASFGVQYSFGVYLKPLAESFHWTRSMTSGAFSLFCVVRGVSAIFTGGLSDRYDPKLVILAAGVLLGLGMALGSTITSLWQLYLFYGILVGLGVGLVFVPMAATIQRWFVARRGLAQGFLICGAGVGILVMSPAAQLLISHYSLSTTYLVIGIAAAVLILAAALLIRKRPEDMGLQPDGGYSPTAINVGSAPEMSLLDYSFSHALGSRPFWFLCLLVYFSGLAELMGFTNIAAHATDLGVPELEASLLLSIMGGCFVGGGIIGGYAGDRLGRVTMITLFMALHGASLLWLTGIESFVWLCAFAAVFGTFNSASWALVPPVTADFFGIRSIGSILGAVMLVYLLGGATGAVLGNAIYDLTLPHSYLPAFWLSGAGLVASSAIFYLLGRPKRGLTLYGA